MSYESYMGAHKARSSHIELFPEAGMVRKTRERSPKNLQNEFRALVAWNQLLAHYSPDEISDPGSLQSPYPISYSLETMSITMSFCNGLTLPEAIHGRHTEDEPVVPRDERAANLAYGLGRLAAIKGIEGLTHGDYRKRHILYNPFQTTRNQPRMSVIDVESTRKADPDTVLQENCQLSNWLYATFSHGRRYAMLRSAYEDGAHSLDSVTDPIWEDAYHTAIATTDQIMDF